MGTGADLSGIEEWELRSLMESASRTVDSYCAVPMLPQRFSFKGGTMIDEDHGLGDSRRIRLRSRPILSVESLKIFATSTQFLDVNPDRLFLENEEGWVEIVEASLTSIGLWGAAIYPSIGLEEYVVRTSYTYGWRFPVTGEYLEPTDGQTFRAINQWWTTEDDVVVYLNGVESNSGFTIDRDEGTVIYPGLDLNDVVTADYTHVLPFEIQQATALVAATSLAERDLTAKGMGQLAEIRVEEVQLRRDARRTGTVVASEAVSDAAQALLAGFRFFSVG